MFVKIHKSYRIVVAICDSDLLGKKFEEGKRQLHIRENFYKDKEVNKEELITIIKRQAMEDASFNIAGKESVQVALELGIIKTEGVHKLKVIPIALILA